MLATLQLIVLLQVVGANAGGLADIMLREVLLPRSPAPALIGDAVNIFNEKSGLEARQDPRACALVLDAISICESLSPGFLTFASSRQAPCLCYSRGTWNPNLFDGAISTCVSYASTASPTDYTAIAELNGFCSSVGNVRGASATASATASTVRSTGAATSNAGSASTATSGSANSATITSRPTTAPLRSNPGCSTVSRLLNSCSSATRGFTDAAVASQAACLCYTSSTWSPDNFDDGVQTCADYVRTAAPTDYSVISALSGFCTEVGDVLAQTASSSASTRAPLTGGGVSAATSVAGGSSTPALTGAPGTTNPTNAAGPVTVTATPSPTNRSGGAVNRWNAMFVGVTAIATSAVLFL